MHACIHIIIFLLAMPICGACNALSCSSMCPRTVIIFLFIINTAGFFLSSQPAQRLFKWNSDLGSETPQHQPPSTEATISWSIASVATCVFIVFAHCTLLCGRTAKPNVWANKKIIKTLIKI